MIDKLEPPTRSAARAVRVASGVALLVLVLVAIVIDGWRAFREGEVAGVILRLVAASVFVVGTLVPLTLVPGMIGAARLRRSHGGIGKVVLVRLDQAASDTICRISPDLYPRTLSTVGMLVADDGISLWGGVWRPYRVFEAGWGRVDSVEVISEANHCLSPTAAVAARLSSGETLRVRIASEWRLGFDTLSFDDSERFVRLYLSGRVASEAGRQARAEDAPGRDASGA